MYIPDKVYLETREDGRVAWEIVRGGVTYSGVAEISDVVLEPAYRVEEVNIDWTNRSEMVANRQEFRLEILLDRISTIDTRYSEPERTN